MPSTAADSAVLTEHRSGHTFSLMLGEFIREHRQDVLDRAGEHLEHLLPDRTEDEVTKHLPLMLDRLIEDLSDKQTDPSNDPMIKKVAADHGKRRHQLGIDIHYVAHDYGVLCEAIAETAEKHGIPVEATDWRRLNRALDVGIAEALSAYEQVKTEGDRRDAAVRIGSVAHELRNSLGAASAAFQAIKEGRVGTGSRTAEILDRQLRYLATLTNGLVTASRLNAKPNAELTSVPLRRMIDDVVFGMPNNRGMQAIVDVDPTVTITADAQLLSSAITNIIQNAFKFSRPGGHVTVTMRDTDDITLIEVEDECGGLSADTAGGLFKPFVQAAADRSGVGLGLSIVQKAMEIQGGAVTVKNLPGQGCSFILSLPRTTR